MRDKLRWKGAICTPRDGPGLGVCGRGRAGVAALAPVSWWAVRLPTRTGKQPRALRAGMAVAAEKGPGWRARVTALQAGWLTLVTAAAMAAW